MVRITCMRCNRSYQLTPEQIATAVTVTRGTKHKHYVVECPYCRYTAKVSLRLIRQAYMRLERAGQLPEVAPVEPPTPEGDAGEASEASEAS